MNEDRDVIAICLGLIIGCLVYGTLTLSNIERAVDKIHRECK